MLSLGDAETRDETIYRYIDILQYLLLQYNTIWPIENIEILHIAIPYTWKFLRHVYFMVYVFVWIFAF